MELESVNPLDQNHLVQMSKDDLDLVAEKVRFWMIAPWIVRGGLAAVALLVLLAKSGNGSDNVETAMLGGFLALAWAISEWGIWRFRKKLNEDIASQQKRVVVGKLISRYSTNLSLTLYPRWGKWVIGKETFSHRI